MFFPLLLVASTVLADAVQHKRGPEPQITPAPSLNKRDGTKTDLIGYYVSDGECMFPQSLLWQAAKTTADADAT